MGPDHKQQANTHPAPSKKMKANQQIEAGSIKQKYHKSTPERTYQQHQRNEAGSNSIQSKTSKERIREHTYNKQERTF